MKWRICNSLMAVFLGLATYVQKNDPDAKLWIFLYGVPMLLCLSAVMSGVIYGIKDIHILIQAHLCLCTAVACYSFINLMNPGEPEAMLSWYEREESRELGGLTFAILWMELLLLYDKSNSDRREKISWIGFIIVALPVLMWMAVYQNKSYQEKIPEHCKTAL